MLFEVIRIHPSKGGSSLPGLLKLCIYDFFEFIFQKKRRELSKSHVFLIANIRLIKEKERKSY